MRKTTLELAAPLLEQAKREAERTGTTLRAVIELALVKLFADSARERDRPFVLRECSAGGGGMTPELAHASWETIRDEVLYPQPAWLAAERGDE